MSQLPDREDLGQVVRQAWAQCKRQEVTEGRYVNPGHLLPWGELTERERETDRRIGEAVAIALGFKIRAREKIAGIDSTQHSGH